MGTKSFGKWLESQYIAWMSKEDRRHTIAEFAQWVGISRPLLSRYMGGSRRPSGKTADLIAPRLGPEVYDLLGFKPPDVLIESLQQHWDLLKESERTHIEKIAEQLEKRAAGKPS